MRFPALTGSTGKWSNRPVMAKLKTGRHTGAQRAHRKAYRRMLRHRAVRRNIRSLAKGFAETVAKEPAKAAELTSQVASAWDKAARHGTVHWKAAARKKSRLARLARKAAAQPPAPAAA